MGGRQRRRNVLLSRHEQRMVRQERTGPGRRRKGITRGPRNGGNRPTWRAEPTAGQPSNGQRAAITGVVGGGGQEAVGVAGCALIYSRARLCEPLPDRIGAAIL